MSSSEPKAMHALPWALDEFASPDIFPAMEPHGSLAAEAALEGTVPADVLHTIEADAYARGVADGERIAREDAERRVAAAVNALADAIDSIRLHEARWVANAEENVAAIAVGVAHHIVQREITTDPSLVHALVQRAIAQFPLDETVTVRVNPDDHAACVSLSNREDVRSRDVRLVADMQIARGGCLVEGRERILDGRVDTALERLYRTIGQVQA